MRCQLVYTLNALTLLQARENAEYAAVLGRADQSVADGVGCVWALRRWLGTDVERVTGLDLVAELCALCVQEQQSVYLLGARPGVAARAAIRLQSEHPGLQIAGVRDGFWRPDEELAVVHDVNTSGAALLLVALGQPRQEIFLDRYRERWTMRVAVGVGGCLDVLAGDLKRAPQWVQKIGMEWLYRLLQEPWRYRRIMQLPKFVWWVLTTKRG